jgi:2-methylisocitrate lyase-like PEP mutase family enzyme
MSTQMFRDLHRASQPLLLPNAWDYASAAMLAKAGFAAVATTSLGVAAAHGLPDGEGATRAETVALTRRLSRLPCLLSVDVEAGFGADPAQVADLAGELAAAGAVGLNLEDGRPAGVADRQPPGLAPVAVQCELIEAVKARVPDMFLNARVDTYWLSAGTLADTVARAQAYVAAGADGVFVPGLNDGTAILALVEAVPVPLNVLYAPGRLSVPELADLGVRRVSCGSLLFRIALQAAIAAAGAIARGEPVTGDAPSYAEVQHML